MKIRIIACLVSLSFSAFAGQYYLPISNGVVRMAGETPYPKEAIVDWRFDGRPVEQLTVDADTGKLRLKTSDELAVIQNARIAKLAAIFESDLRLLQVYLNFIGLSIPVSELEVKQRINALIQSGELPPDSSIIGNIGVTWNALKEGLKQAGASTDDIEAMWLSLTEEPEDEA